MQKRTLKVFFITGLLAAAIYLLFNLYLPEKVQVNGYDLKGKRAQPRVRYPIVTRAERKNKPEEVKESIAPSLGVPRPRTITLSRFNPENIRKQKKKVRQLFEVPKKLETEVNFWKDIYTKYDKTKVVFHDKEHLEIIYSVLDIKDVVENDGLSDEEKWRRKKKRVDDEENRIETLLLSIEKKPPNQLTKEEKRIFDMFAGINEHHKFKRASASGRLRSQTGIADKFKEGIRVAGRYLGEMEKIFSEYGVPLEVTRLAFVESMFNLEALSKVGASGIWQFMPSSGRLFLSINQVVDERNDPISATHGAAKHLVRDYDILLSWPLAINSYNSGRGRLENAVRRLGTKDISRIIKEYSGRGYGFASRNFYPAFLAALTVFEDRGLYFGEIEMEEPLTYDEITTPFFATLPELSKYTGVPPEKLLVLNPHFQREVTKGELPIPSGFLLKVPSGLGEDFLVAMNEMEGQKKSEKWHVVEKGENLKTIAAKYKTSVAEVKRANGLRKNSLNAGQVLKLPKGIALAKED